MMALEGGSFVFQLGGQATDFVLLVMNERGAKGILSNKVEVGADASAAAGPKGRDASAETDVTVRAEILSYSRSRGHLPACRSKDQRYGRTTMPMKKSMARMLMRKTSFLRVRSRSHPRLNRLYRH